MGLLWLTKELRERLDATEEVEDGLRCANVIKKKAGENEANAKLDIGSMRLKWRSCSSRFRARSAP